MQNTRMTWNGSKSLRFKFLKIQNKTIWIPADYIVIHIQTQTYWDYINLKQTTKQLTVKEVDTMTNEESLQFANH